MAKSVIPNDEELEAIILGPDSIVWQRFSDARIFLGAGAALLLQVAHPTVGSGVRDFSNFQREPWDRLLRTLDYLSLLVYGGAEAGVIGKRLRAAHKTIKGVNPDGSRYHALEPEAYAWVHATLIEAGIRAHKLFVGPLSAAEIEAFYAEYLPLGRLVGVREGDLPERWLDFRDYVDTMIAERLERTETVETVLKTMRIPAAPPVFPEGLDPLWKLLRVPPSHALRLATYGLLGDSVRARLGMRWNRAAELELGGFGLACRAAGPLLPGVAKLGGPAYLEWRREAIRRGPLGADGPYADAATAAVSGAAA